MRFRKTILAFALCAALVLSTAACGGTENTQSASGAPASSENVSKAPTASSEATPAVSPTAEPTPEPTVSSAPESSDADEKGEETEITAELEAMAPLIEAHILAQMNGMVFDADDPVYFWQTTAFAVDSCGMTFYSAETTGSALTLSRGVIEEIASGLFESAANEDLPDIPEALAGEISYDETSDTYARPMSGGGFSVTLQSCEKNGDVYTVTAALIRDENEAEPQAVFTAELVPNPREDNTVFIYSIRTVKQIS